MYDSKISILQFAQPHNHQGIAHILQNNFKAAEENIFCKIFCHWTDNLYMNGIVCQIIINNSFLFCF